MQKSLLVVCIMACCASACSSISSKHTKAQAEQINQCKAELPVSKKVKMQSVTSGCLMSVAVSKMTGSNNPAPMLCLAGGTSGFLLGESIAERKCGYITLEEQLDGEISHAAKMNAGFSVVFMQQEMALKKHELSAAGLSTQKASDEQGQVALSAFEQKLVEQLKQDQALLANTQNEFRFKRETLEKSRKLKQQEKEDKLLAEIRALQKSIKVLQENRLKLARLKNSLTLADS